MLSRVHLIPERDGQTDGRTELLYQYRASKTVLEMTAAGLDTR